MRSIDIEVLSQAKSWLNNGEAVWLCTVLSTYGSAPRSPGALFATTINGKYVGSLSGGCIEDHFLEQIAMNQFTQSSQIIRYGYNKGDYPPKLTLPCGGSIKILIEYLTSCKNSQNYIKEMLSALQGQTTLQKQINIGESAKLSLVNSPLMDRVIQHENRYTISLQSPITILIASLSAVALYCIDFALALGFSVIICEDREEELRQIKESHFLQKITLIEDFPPNYIEQRGCTNQTAVLSLTHDPRIDDLSLIAALETNAFYIGAMGSKLNSENRIARLKECTDFSDDILSRIHAPIGLPLNSKTPPEIALAIMAEIVQIKNATPSTS